MIDAPTDEESKDSVDAALADARELITDMRRFAHSELASDLEQIVQRVDRMTHDYRIFVSERDAMVRADKSMQWFKRRFEYWRRERNARYNPLNPRERQYRLCVVPVAADVARARADARRAAHGEG